MLVLVHNAPATLEREHGRHPNLGVLMCPRRWYPDAVSWPWAADNGAFGAWDAVRFERMLDAIAGWPGCLFVTAPDVVGDAEATLERFDAWEPRMRSLGQPVALVAQNGLEDPPWDRFDALFVGGSGTDAGEWKLSEEASRLGREAKRRGKWLHMGRVNSRQRVTFAKAIGCDSVDGSAFSMYREAHLPWALEYAAHAQQLTMAGRT